MEKLVDDKILSKIEELLELLTKNQDYQKYLLVSKKMKENKEIMDSIKKIKQYQKQIVMLEYQKKDITTLENKINSILKKLDSYPIYKEYSYLVDDLNSLFYMIKTLFEKFFVDTLEK